MSQKIKTSIKLIIILTGAFPTVLFPEKSFFTLQIISIFCALIFIHIETALLMTISNLAISLLILIITT